MWPETSGEDLDGVTQGRYLYPPAFFPNYHFSHSVQDFFLPEAPLNPHWGRVSLPQSPIRSWAHVCLTTERVQSYMSASCVSRGARAQT